jgi:hypothetical protein
MSRRSGFQVDAIWHDRSGIEVVFKAAPSAPDPKEIASWHKEVWNLGVAPLLWIVSPQKIEIYNTFERPLSDENAKAHRLKTFQTLDAELQRLDDYAGRLSMLSGRFWTNERRVDREGRVDQQLLGDLKRLEDLLFDDGLSRQVAQGLVGRSIFIRYLTDRGIVTEDMLEEFGSTKLDEILCQQTTAYRLFDWIRDTFNGDLFPIEPSERRLVRSRHLQLVARTLTGVSPVSGQGSLWPYKFDVIPIELISSIYEQFAHSGDSESAEDDGLHYTPIPLVHLVLDEVMREIKPEARILDMTCGSGIFLVEALRRLVKDKAKSGPVTRQIIRRTIKEQIFGVDKNAAAVRVASFSLYLTALELDPDPRPPKALRFEPLIGRNLFVADALNLKDYPETDHLRKTRFDAVVGNPPWTYSGTEKKPKWGPGSPALPPRSQDFAFVWKSLELAHDDTHFGIVMRATPFFSAADASRRARNQLFDRLAPVALVNLAALRDDLFPNADYPAVVLYGRLHNQKDKSTLPVVTIPWTSSFSRSGTFEISPSDVHFVSLKDIRDTPYALKSVALGTPRDRLVLRKLTTEFHPLAEILERLGLTVVTGVQPLDGDRNDASFLLGLPFLNSGELKFRIDTSELPAFTKDEIHRPRTREAFRAPLVLLGEGLRDARILVGLASDDLVYTRSFYGISFADKSQSDDLACCLAGILHSSLSSWHLLLAASEFGVHKRKALLQDILQIPIPDLGMTDKRQIKTVADAVRNFDSSSRQARSTWLEKLDDAVCDLYQVSEQDRLVIQDGVARAEREYLSPRLISDQPISTKKLEPYAEAFLQVLNAWCTALKRSPFDAEIFNVRREVPLRIVRFAAGGNGKIKNVDVDDDLNQSVAKIGKRMRLPIAERLAAVRELRVHAERELYVIKPSASRYWTPRRV